MPEPQHIPPTPAAGSLRVPKTYKLYIGGAFKRSESGRSYPVRGSGGTLLAHAPLASRKDLRDAVTAARKAQPGWAAATAYHRGQVLYRVAEILDGRRAQFVAEISATGSSRKEAVAEVDACVDRWIWYAGWTDKLGQVAGATNPVAGPYVSFSMPEPTGVVGIIAPPSPSLLGLASVIAPVIATGNTSIVLTSQQHPLPALSLAEVLATSDLPGGVANLLSGDTQELTPWLAGHRDVNALDLTGLEPPARADVRVIAAGTVKRVYGPGTANWDADPGTGRLTAFVETKTIWHSVGT